MSTITPGTGGTIKASTAEGQLLEIVTYLRNQERIRSNTTITFERITSDISFTDYKLTGAFDFPCEKTQDSTGKTVFNIPEYLANMTFSPGTGGTFKSTSAANYLKEVVEYMQTLEATSTNNPQGQNLVNTTYATDDGTITGTFEIFLDITTDATNGNLIVEAREYLVS